MGASEVLTEDVLEADSAPADTPAANPIEPQSPFAGMGALLEEPDEKKVCDAIVALVQDDGVARKRRRAEWECNKLWLRGVRGARVRRTSEDRNQVELVVPLGAFDLPPVMDRTDELLEKVVAHLLADPAVPDAEPSTDNDADRDSAEFTTRLLTVEGSESGFNNQALMRRAERKAGVYGSGFIYPCLDPVGGGWRPMEMRALPTATSKADAIIDPKTGEQVGADDERLETRYVTQAGELTDDASKAARQWLPKIVPEVLTGENVVLLPATCSSINDAHGVIIIRFTPLSRLRTTYQEKLGKLKDNEKLQTLVDWRPEEVKAARPGFMTSKDVKARATTTDAGAVKESALVCTLSLYYKSHGPYPKGAYVTVAGGDMVLHRQPWAGMVEVAQGELNEECLELPMAQVRQMDDDVDDDPYGYGLVKKLGPADEVRGDIVLAWQEYLDKFLHPIPFLPLGSIVQPDQLAVRDDTPVFFNPQGKPEYESAPPFPADAKEFFDRATSSQDSAVMLEQTAQGVDSPNSVSGVAKQYVIQQAHVNMTTIRSNLADAQERLWRVIAQLYRVFYTVPLKLKYLGDDGSYKEREWTRADLGSTRDIRIARGSFTQQSPEQKQASLDARYQQKLIDPEEYDRLSASNVRATIGIQDNPHRLRVRRQITRWRDGPPKRLQQLLALPAPTPAAPPQGMQPGMQPGQPGQPPMAAPQPPQIPPELNPFADARPVDQEQDVARIRYLELRREIAGTAFAKKPPAWAQLLVDAYNGARQAAGVMTLAEQQAAQQQAASAQADAEAKKEQQKMTMKAQEKAMELTAKSQQADADRSFEREQGDAKLANENERRAMTAEGATIPDAQALSAAA